MKFVDTTVGGGAEILAADEFVAIPKKLSGTTGVVKAGTPITAAGAADTDGAAAVGILLYDVDLAANPNGALVVQGVIDLTKAKAHSGVSGMTAANLKTAVPGLICRTDIGVNS